MNRLDMFNELSVLGMSYLLMIISTLSKEGELKHDFGWLMIALFGINLLTNICYITLQMLI